MHNKINKQAASPTPLVAAPLASFIIPRFPSRLIHTVFLTFFVFLLFLMIIFTDIIVIPSLLINHLLWDCSPLFRLNALDVTHMRKENRLSLLSWFQ